MISDLIRRRDVIVTLKTLECLGYIECKTAGAIKEIEDIPSVDRPQGHWEIYTVSPFDGEDCRCSECGALGCAPYWDYCPYCGAKMEGVDND